MLPIHHAHIPPSAFFNTNTKASIPSPIEGESPSSIFEKTILTWLPPSTSFLGDPSSKCIHLIRRAENYLVRVVDYLFFKVHKEISLDLPQELAQQPEKDIVHYLKKFTVSNEADLEITQQLNGYPTRRCGTQEFALRSSNGRPLWFLYDSVENSASWLPVSANDVNILHAIPEGEMGKLFKNYTVKIVARNGRLQDVFLSKSFTKSKLDPTQSITEDFWAITLISTGRSSETDTGCGHAKILYETFQGGIYSLFYAHLTTEGASPGHATVKIGKLSLNAPIQYRHKSPTWIKSRDRVLQMIQKLYAEKGSSLPFTLMSNPAFIDHLRVKFIGHLRVNKTFYLFQLFWAGLLLTRFYYATCWERKDLLPIDHILKSIRTIQRQCAEGQLTPYCHLPSSYNCLTWAVKKIRLTGVDLPLIYKIITVPDSYISSLSSGVDLPLIYKIITVPDSYISSLSSIV